MALTDDNSMVMPVTPMYGNGNGCGFGGDWSSWIILFLLFGMFNGNGWGGGFGGGMWGADGLYPWLNNSQNINGGFRDQMLSTQLQGIQNGVTSGFGDVQTALCGGFAGVNASINGAQNAISAQMYGNQIADLERSFAAQTANMQGFNGVNTGVSDLRYTVATEACADRAAVGDALQNITMQNMGNTNAIVNAINGGIQSIKDQICDYRNAQKDDTIANLRQELMYSRGQASQVEQTAQLLANNNAQTALFQQGMSNEVDALYNRLKNCPVGTTPVYGNQPIFTCPQTVNSCGCGNNGF